MVSKLRKHWATDEHVVSVASGRVVRARGFRIYLADRAFDLEYVRNVIGIQISLEPWRAMTRFCEMCQEPLSRETD